MQLLTTAFDDRVVGVVEFARLAAQHNPVAFLEIGDGSREGRQGQGVGAEINAIFAPADGERRTATRADQQIIFALKKKSQREGALQAFKRGGDGVLRRCARFQPVADKMRDNFRVGFGGEAMTASLQLFAQLAKVFDDAIMHDDDFFAGVRMGVVLGRLAMRRPARMADAGGAG